MKCVKQYGGAVGLGLMGLFLFSGCQETELTKFSYFDERISPVLQGGCVRSPSGGGCHLADSVGTALGNLDLSTYDALMRRDDVLAAYGPYSVGLLLLKAGQAVEVQVETFDPDPERHFVSITSDIRHNNGATVDVGSTGYNQLKQWVEAGHTRTGVPDEELRLNEGSCVHGVGTEPGFDPSAAPTDQASFQRFVSEVQPVLNRTCSGSSCHGSSIADLYLTCGEDEAEQRWNYWVSVQHLTDVVSTSGFLRRPLSTFRGGVYHEGGNIFASTEDEDYQVLRGWAEELVERTPAAVAPPTDISEGLRYFANRVQPVMVRKGCMLLNCHSLPMFHDLRLRGGAQGLFSEIATRRNYEMSKLLLAPDASEPNESRIIAKNLYPPELVAGTEGLFHRGGPLFEDFGANTDGTIHPASVADCASFDLDNGDLNEVPAYCIFVRWHQIERQEAIDAGEVFPDTELVRSVAWISRPTDVGEARDFDTYRPGADLLSAPATMTGAELNIGASGSLLGGCGLDAATADIRGLSVDYDGSRLAFGARSSAGAPQRLYWMNVDGSACEPIPSVAPTSDAEDGILMHDFDPVFAPDGRLVFASTRGNSDPEILGRAGPTRTPAAMQPNSNLYLFDPGTSEVRQLTFLLNQELQPSFMTDGRLIMTSEKREPDFHQLAGRRMNLDGGDYHPLFAQRDSVGFTSATEIIELLDRNFAMVASPLGSADGAGTIVIANRSIGPDQNDRDPEDRYYIASQRFPAPGAFSGGTGVYRSPAALPTGRVLVSCDQAATSLTTGGYDYQLCELDIDSGNVRVLGGQSGRADIEAVPIFARLRREIFESRIDEANAHTEIEHDATDAQINVVDFPMIATLIFSNTRIGRPINDDIGGINVYGEYPPPAGTSAFSDVSAEVVEDAFGSMFLHRELLGNVPLNADGSARFQYQGGLPIVLGATDHSGVPLMFPDGAPFSGEVVQREQMQFYPGERSNQSFRRELFNGMCGGCHGSITGREVDVAVDVDILTSASQVMSSDQLPLDLR